MCLFRNEIKALDVRYENVRDSTCPKLVRTKNSLEDLWKEYEPYADQDFKQKISEDFESRFWEMYLTVSLLRAGCSIQPRKRLDGPDIEINYSGKSIWIEAVAPTSGDPYLPDSVPDFRPSTIPTSFAVPDDAITLRIRSAIEEKYHKWTKWREDEVVADNEPYIIAVNTCKIPISSLEKDIPRIVRSVFPIGNEQFTFNIPSFQTINHGYEFKPGIIKSSGKSVSTSIFLDQQYKYLSAILSSTVNPVTAVEMIQKENMLGDYTIVHNPLALAKIEIVKTIENYMAKPNDNGWAVHRVISIKM